LPYKPQDLVFAISLEPKGGSPTGVATGPIVFSGPLLQSD
jgi:anti-sigma-K factor RskA